MIDVRGRPPALLRIRMRAMSDTVSEAAPGMRRRPPSLRPRSVLPNSAPPLVAAAFERFVDVAPAACQTARDRISCSGVAVRICRMLKRCFLAGPDHRPEERENLRAFEGAETARDLHLDLHHPQILFSQVVGEWHVEV